jgi:hypothetical protein
MPAPHDSITVAEALRQGNLYDILHTPISEEAYQQYMNLIQDLENLPQSQDDDSWSYIWGAKSYSVSKAYKALSGTFPAHPILKLVWKAK